jgi:hypothetical protein
VTVLKPMQRWSKSVEVSEVCGPHALGQEINKEETKGAFEEMKGLLNDPELLIDSHAIKALKQVTDLQNETLIVSKTVDKQAGSHLSQLRF